MAALKAKGKLKEVPAWTEARPKPRNLGLGAEKVETKVTEQKVEEKETKKRRTGGRCSKIMPSPKWNAAPK